MKGDFHTLHSWVLQDLLTADAVDVGEWHSQDVSGNPLLVTRELTNYIIEYPIPPTIEELQEEVKPNLPFAEAQFQDRVSGEPLNPPPSHTLWPWLHEASLSGGKFSHTYSERFWPKRATAAPWHCEQPELHGIREPYGDLGDVVRQLERNPYTRQAYLPVFFPEDTGNVSNVRVPCTLGYHFLYRAGALNITYFIRAVDFVRHFRDDVYMACRLCQWVVEQLTDHEGFMETPGRLTMHIVSLHYMKGDEAKLRKEYGATR